MPDAPWRPCRECRGPITRETYCPKCKIKIEEREKDFQRKRKSNKERGYPANWEARSKMFRNNHPICQGPGYNGRGCHNSTWGVHHIDGNPSNNKESNLMAICFPCHSRVHRLDRWKKGGANVSSEV